MLNNNKGVIHIVGILFILMLAVMLVHYFNAQTRGTQQPIPQGTAPQGQEETQIDTQSYVSRPENTRLRAAENAIYSAVDIQAKLLRLKADAVLIAWDTLEEKDQQRILKNFTREIREQQAQTNRFLDEFGSPGWIAMENNKKKVKVEELLKSITAQQGDLMKFVKNMNEIALGRPK